MKPGPSPPENGVGWAFIPGSAAASDTHSSRRHGGCTDPSGRARSDRRGRHGRPPGLAPAPVSVHLLCLQWFPPQVVSWGRAAQAACTPRPSPPSAREKTRGTRASRGPLRVARLSPARRSPALQLGPAGPPPGSAPGEEAPGGPAPRSGDIWADSEPARGLKTAPTGI